MLSAEGYFDGNVIQTFGSITAKKNQKVVITFLDEFVVEKAEIPSTARGILSEFAKPNTLDLVTLEKDAWRKAAIEKHENN